MNILGVNKVQSCNFKDTVIAPILFLTVHVCKAYIYHKIMHAETCHCKAQADL